MHFESCHTLRVLRIGMGRRGALNNPVINAVCQILRYIGMGYNRGLHGLQDYM